MIDRQRILKMMIQPDEKLLCAKVLDQADFSLRKHEHVFTDFCDMAKAAKFLELTRGIVGLYGKAYGGRDGCERQRLGFAPDYMEIKESDFPITPLLITRNKKFGQSDLGHGDFLGSLLGLGIDRGKTGDILVMEEGTLCYVDSDISEYICNNLKKVSRTPVVIRQAKGEDLGNFSKTLTYRTFTVPSLRLDAVAGVAFHLSRGKVQELIHKELAQVNWTIQASSSNNVKEGDIISIRGFGRFRLEEIGNLTKKGRISIVVGIY